jgi:hypothetical protein
MASPKKAAAKKSATRKVAKPKVKTKKAVAKKASAATPEIKKGSKLACEVCGFAVTVDRLCGCAEETHFICCGEPMEVKKAKATRK